MTRASVSTRPRSSEAASARASASAATRSATQRMRVISLAGFLLPLAFSLSSSEALADIHRTVGKDGVISFSSTKTPGSTRVIRERRTQIHMPSDHSVERLTRYDSIILEAATLYQIPEELIRAVMKAESNFDPRALSPAGAHGLMQLMPFTAERMMVTDIMDPRQNIMGGTRYLRILANMFNGDIHLTVAAYNAGEGAVIRYGGIPPYEETQNYVVKVLENYQRYREESARKLAAL